MRTMPHQCYAVRLSRQEAPGPPANPAFRVHKPLKIMGKQPILGKSCQRCHAVHGSGQQRYSWKDFHFSPGVCAEQRAAAGCFSGSGGQETRTGARSESNLDGSGRAHRSQRIPAGDSGSDVLSRTGLLRGRSRCRVAPADRGVDPAASCPSAHRPFLENGNGSVLAGLQLALRSDAAETL